MAEKNFKYTKVVMYNGEEFIVKEPIDRMVSYMNSTNTGGSVVLPVIGINGAVDDHPTGYVNLTKVTYLEETILTAVVPSEREVHYEHRTEEIPYETVEQDDASIAVGDDIVVRTGVNGVVTISEEVVTLDGEEVERNEISRQVTAEPIAEILNVGIREPEETTAEETTTEAVPFESVEQNNADMLVGERNVVQDGVDGERTIVERVYYRDGVEYNREVISNEVTTDPVDEIVDVGTKEPDPEEPDPEEPDPEA